MIDRSLLHDLKCISSLIDLPFPGNAWLTRGAVRCSFLNDVRPFDDLDVIVDAPTGWIDEKFRPISFKETIYGGFKIKLSSGRDADVWSLHNTMGQNCHKISDALKLFEFSCDAIAIDIYNGSVVGKTALSLLKKRSFEVQNAFPFRDTSIEFLVAKGCYLSLRHNLRPGPKLKGLIASLNHLEEIDMYQIRSRQRDELLSIFDIEELQTRLSVITRIRFDDLFPEKLCK